MTGIASAETSKRTLFDFEVESVTGERVALSQYRGKVALVVNTASRCGFTSQYADLEAIYKEYAPQGLVVLGFPSNDFGEQEPGTNAEIKQFCELKYKTTFPIFAKGPVKGPEKQPVYAFLTEESSSEFQGDPGWNFVKFLVDREGHVIGRFSSMTRPTGGKLRSAIEQALQRKAS